MDSLTATELRANLKKVLDRVNEQLVPILIRRRRGRAVVLLDAEIYRRMLEMLPPGSRFEPASANPVAEPSE